MTQTQTEINWPKLAIPKVRGPVPYVPETLKRHPQPRIHLYFTHGRGSMETHGSDYLVIFTND